MELNENLTFSFSDSFFKDLNTIDKIMKEYLSTRNSFYIELFCDKDDYTEEDIQNYINYFLTPSDDLTQDVYPDLYHIHHFLERDYEVYIQEDICELRNQLYAELTNCELESTQDFISLESERIENLTTLWQNFLEKIAESPILDLDTMDYQNIYGVQCYFSKDVQPFVEETFMNFMENIHDAYPNTLLKLDTIVIVPLDYIQFVGGEGTQAFFTDNTLFLADSCNNCDNEEDRVFYETVLYHETGHFIFSLMSETSQIYWADLYNEWRDKGTKMTRDDDRNSQLVDEDGYETGEFVEELFADTFATLFLGDKLKDDYYIHKPSSLITDSLDFILRNEYN